MLLFCFLDSGTPASWMCVCAYPCVYLCLCQCLCMQACNCCVAAVSFWVVYGSHSTPSSCSSVSHVIIWATVIGWERSRRGGRVGMDGQREGSVTEEGVGRRRLSNVRSKQSTNNTYSSRNEKISRMRKRCLKKCQTCILTSRSL